MDEKKDAEFLASLIDEISMEDTVEQRMNSFTRDKERKKRIERARESSSQFQQKYSNQAVEQARQERQPIDLEHLEVKNQQNTAQNRSNQAYISNAQVQQSNPSSSQDATRVFPQNPTTQSQSDQTHTRVIRNEDLPNLDQQPKMPSSSKEDNRYQKIALGVLGVILVLGLCFGGYFLISSMGSSSSNPLQTTDLQSLLSWIDSVDLDDISPEQILRYESMYNQLSSSQKEQINTLLKSKTGYDFDQLLAQAKSANKGDSTNNDREIAEKKAQLRDEINYLEGQLSILESTLVSLTESIDEAQAKVTGAQAIVDQAQGRFDSANANVVQTQTAISGVQAEISDNNRQLTEVNRQLSQISSTSDSDYQNLLAQKNTLENKLRSLQSDLESYNSLLPGYQSTLAQAQGELETAQSSLDAANLELERAQSSLSNQTTRLEGQIKSLQNQIDSKNKELEELDKD